MGTLEELQRELARALTGCSNAAVQQSGDSSANQPRGGVHSEATNPPLATATEHCLIAELSKAELNRSRETLFRKRLAQTRGLLPRTASTLGRNFAELFREFANRHHFAGHQAPQRDAIGFSNWLMSHQPLPPWLLEMAGWEALPQRWSISPRALIVMRLRYPVWQANFKLELTSEPNRRTSVWLAYRWGRMGAIRRIL